ncbi:MAG: BMP family ABC transporter substrate-binding protein, partial [Actinomycetales bacterium]|nr:BMP family ABC transporter substrate-binding protein [Actinomycetales bacterium]
VLKQVGGGAADVTTSAGAGNFTNAPFVGTLANDGVGLAPFHDFASKVKPGLQAELDAIKAGIIDGSIKVESPSSPE